MFEKFTAVFTSFREKKTLIYFINCEYLMTSCVIRIVNVVASVWEALEEDFKCLLERKEGFMRCLHAGGLQSNTSLLI